MKIKRQLLITICLFGLIQLHGQETDSSRFFKNCPKELFIITQFKPEFPGGDKNLLEMLRKIEVDKSHSQNIEIFLRINCQGEAMDFRLIKEGKANDIEKQVFNILSAQKIWIPARQGQSKVNSVYLIKLQIKGGKFIILKNDYGTFYKWNDPRFKDNL